MKSKILNIKDRLFLSLFILGWGTIGYAVMEMMKSKNAEEVAKSLEIAKSLF